MAKAIAICSCPRLGFMDFMGVSIAAFARNGVAYSNAFGVFWAKALASTMKSAVEAGYEYIFTCDYDSLFKAEQVQGLIELMEGHPEADAITTVQMGRFFGPLMATKSGEITEEEAKQDLVPLTRGHFGLTIFRTSGIKDIDFSWFEEAGKDDDIAFWDHFIAQDKHLFLASRLVIGHLELMIKWPDENMQEMYQKIGQYHEQGAPGDVWS